MRRWLCALLAVLGCLAWPAHALEVDRDGQPLRLDAAPMRIVSLLPSLTETVCALDACERLVGVDRYSNWPASVRALPQVGGGLDPNIEAVMALRPDLVLIGESSRAAMRLRALGLPVLALEPRTLAGLREVTERLGELLQVPGAPALLARIDAGLAAAAASVPPAARGQRVYYEVTPAPFAAGAGSFVDELLELLGLHNIIDDPALGPFPRINPELVVRADPDLIIVSQGGADAMRRRPGWARLRALQDGHVCQFDAAQRDILVRPGPRMPLAAQMMADCAAGRWTGTLPDGADAAAWTPAAPPVENPRP